MSVKIKTPPKMDLSPMSHSARPDQNIKQELAEIFAKRNQDKLAKSNIEFRKRHHSDRPVDTKRPATSMKGSNNNNMLATSPNADKSGKRKERGPRPSHFLLGGNEDDPLNLNSLWDEDVNRLLNQATPTSSPLPTPTYPKEKVEILLPNNPADPLNLNRDDDTDVTPKGSRKKKKKGKGGRKRNSMSSLSGAPLDGTSGGEEEDDRILDSSIDDEDATTPVKALFPLTIDISKDVKPSSSGPASFGGYSMTVRDRVVSPITPKMAGKKRKRTVSEGAVNVSQRDDWSTQPKAKRHHVSPVRPTTPPAKMQGRRHASPGRQSQVKQARSGSTPVKQIIAQQTTARQQTQQSPVKTAAEPDRDPAAPATTAAAAVISEKGSKDEETEPTPDQVAATPCVETLIKSQPKDVQHPGQIKGRCRRGKPRQKTFVYGNYSRYYGYRNPDHEKDHRLLAFQKEWFEWRDVLDIGCNTGHVTLAVARDLEPRSITGMDIDGQLIKAAKNNMRYYLSPERSRAGRPFLDSMKSQYGPIAAPPTAYCADDAGTFPNNVHFVQGNYVLSYDEELDMVKEQYDMILALSVTKWLHLHHGDAGLKRAFRRMFLQLRPGGRLILEPQNWQSYKRRKKLTPSIAETFASIRLKPDQFRSYLLSREVGFSKCETLEVPFNKAKGFQRPLYLFTKSDTTFPTPRTDSRIGTPYTPSAIYGATAASARLAPKYLSATYTEGSPLGGSSSNLRLRVERVGELQTELKSPGPLDSPSLLKFSRSQGPLLLKEVPKSTNPTHSSVSSPASKLTEPMAISASSSFKANLTQRIAAAEEENLSTTSQNLHASSSEPLTSMSKVERLHQQRKHQMLALGRKRCVTFSPERTSSNAYSPAKKTKSSTNFLEEGKWTEKARTRSRKTLDDNVRSPCATACKQDLSAGLSSPSSNAGLPSGPNSPDSICSSSTSSSSASSSCSSNQSPVVDQRNAPLRRTSSAPCLLESHNHDRSPR